MSLTTPKPTALLSRLDIAGCPWHGLVSGGELQRGVHPPKQWAQDASLDYYRSGMVRRVKVPGVPPVLRSPDQEAADLDDGKQWWPDALLSGPEAVLYNKRLGAGAWIYCAPDGSRWRVTTTLEGASPTGNQSADFTLQRFGEFGRAPEQYLVAAVTPPDMGQSSPAVGTIVHGLRLCDTSPAGDAAIYVIDAAILSGRAASQIVPFGFVLVTITGAAQSASISIEVLRTRQQTLGTVSSAGPGVAQVFGRAGELRVDTTSSWTSDWFNGAVCSGQFTTTRTPTLILQGDGEPSTGQGLQITINESAGWKEATLAGRIVSMFFDGQGDIKEITLHADARREISAPPPAWGAMQIGETVLERQGAPGNCSQVEISDMPWSYVVQRNASSSGHLTLSLRVGNAVVDSVTYSYSSSVAATINASRDAQPTPIESLTFNAAFTPGAIDTDPRAGVIAPENVFVALPRDFDFPAEIESLALSINCGVRSSWVMIADNQGDIAAFTYRLAPDVICLAQQTRNTLAADWSFALFALTATRFGAKQTPALTLNPASNEEDIPVLYGSACPVTQQLAIATEPVCWV